TTRLEVDATLASNRWAIYELQLLDQNNKLVLAGIKNAGQGTQRGARAARNMGFDLKLDKAEPFKVAISLIELSDPQGKAVQEALAFRVTTKVGLIDTVPLWFALISLLGLGLISWSRRRD
ncbi:hypothetical protein IQ266_27360, partial [filamentous cyanobacterium LEGE 11480]